MRNLASALAFPFTFTWGVICGAGFLLAFFATVILGAASACATLAGVVLAVAFRDPEWLLFTIAGIVGGLVFGLVCELWERVND